MNAAESVRVALLASAFAVGPAALAGAPPVGGEAPVGGTHGELDALARNLTANHNTVPRPGPLDAQGRYTSNLQADPKQCGAGLSVQQEYLQQRHPYLARFSDIVNAGEKRARAVQQSNQARFDQAHATEAPQQNKAMQTVMAEQSRMLAVMQECTSGRLTQQQCNDKVAAINAETTARAQAAGAAMKQSSQRQQAAGSAWQQGQNQAEAARKPTTAERRELDQIKAQVKALDAQWQPRVAAASAQMKRSCDSPCAGRSPDECRQDW